MILVAKELAFYDLKLIEPGQSFQVPDDFVIPAWAEKAKKGTKPEVVLTPPVESNHEDAVI